MDKRKIRDGFRLLGSICFFGLYPPHYLVFMIINGG